MAIMNHTKLNIVRARIGKEPTELDLENYNTEMSERRRERQKSDKKKYLEKVYSDPVLKGKYLDGFKNRYRNRMLKKGVVVTPQPRHETDQERSEARKKSQRKYWLNNLEKERARRRNFARENKHKVLARQKKRLLTDPVYYLVNKLRHRLYLSIRATGVRKCSSAVNLAGCSMPELKSYLESKFSEGMSWDLLLAGKIHVDHKVPCAAFDMSKEDQQKACFHFTNLVPSWPVDNIVKNSIYNGKRWRHSDHVQPLTV